ncbi:MAG: hypothetical protein U0638_08345 [Phycisphaerales bacterium]
MDLASLWLTILLSAVAVCFVAMTISGPGLHHKHDYFTLPTADEDTLMDTFRKLGIKPGNYVIPDIRSHVPLDPEKVKKALEQGPVAHLTLWRTPLTMGDKMIATLIVHIVVTFAIAYLASIAIPGPASFARVFRVVGTAGVLAYSFAFIPVCIWDGTYVRSIVFRVLDGIVYGLITGAIFAWRWPH